MCCGHGICGVMETPRPGHKNKAIMCLSSHPSHLSLSFDSNLVVVMVEIGFMETRPKPISTTTTTNFESEQSDSWEG